MYQTCPKCRGQGTISQPPWIDGNTCEWTDGGGSFVCPVCKGEKVIETPHDLNCPKIPNFITT